MSDTSFKQKYEKRYSRIKPKRLFYSPEEEWMYESLYKYIEDYAFEHELINTALGLPAVRAAHDGQYKDAIVKRDDVIYRLPYVNHCLSVCRTLLNYDLPLNAHEMDICLSAALTHDLPLLVPANRLRYVMLDNYNLDREVYELVALMAKSQLIIPEEERDAFFGKVRSNKLALLIRVVDRSNIIEHLYNVSVLKAKEYLLTTRKYYIPLCIHGIVNYPDLANIYSLLAEKLRVLSEASDILITRYEKREQELMNEIMQLQEENAWMRSILDR